MSIFQSHRSSSRDIVQILISGYQLYRQEGILIRKYSERLREEKDKIANKMGGNTEKYFHAAEKSYQYLFD